MNNYRLRLVLASACLTAALTVLALKLGGFLLPAAQPGEIRLLGTHQGASTEPSPWRIGCSGQVATIAGAGQGQAPLRILDPQGRPLGCTGSLSLSSPDQ